MKPLKPIIDDVIIVGVPLKMKVIKVKGEAVLAEPIDSLRKEYAFIWEANKLMPKMYVLQRPPKGAKDGLSHWRRG